MRKVVALALGMVLTALVAVAPAPAGKKESIQIAISRTLFDGVPDKLALSIMRPFSALMEGHTGLGGEMSVSDDPFKLGQRLVKNEIQIGVMEGIEFAWIRDKHTQVQPLAISINQERVLRACLVVRAGTAKDWGDLEKKTLAIPQFSRRHCRLFAEHQCQQQAREQLERYFARVTRPDTAEEALDDLVDQKVDAAVVDNVSLECFKRQKPGRHSQLQLLKESTDFPASVIVFCRGRFDEGTLKNFREGLLTAHKSAVGRHLLTMWKLTAFEAVPNDYDKTLTEITRTYPPPQTP